MKGQAQRFHRRRFLGGSLAATGAGIVGVGSIEEQALLARAEGGSADQDNPPAVTGLAQGRLGDLSVSRLICGGNLFSGFAHSRELIYVSALMKHYFTPERIIETLQLCEQNGINTAIMRCDEHITGVLERYRKEYGGKIQWIAQTYPSADNPTDNIQLAIDHGAVGAFIQGGIADRLVSDRRLDVIQKATAFMKQNGLAAGLGSHSLETPRVIEKEKLDVDFYFKTLNSVGYESQEPQEVADFMKTVSKPWIAFKVLGAGAVKPEAGFRLALSLGADFLNVGMFDFQVRGNAATMKKLLAQELSRQRPWVS